MNNYTDTLKKMSNEELLKEFVTVNTSIEEVNSELTEEMILECRIEILLRMSPKILTDDVLPDDVLSDVL